ncbi:MAG: class I tRNA ligase family protein [Candidatus Paceibacterota bacterium]
MLKKDNFSPPEIEEKVLEKWNAQGIFEKSLNKNKGKKEFVFYEGPPGANGKPGMHHMLSRFYKDIIPRYKTMRGFNVPRQAGWDTHGLPVEIAVEKELEINNKDQIEKYGIGPFNQKAKELVFRYKDNWEEFTTKIGYWLDTENAYMTCSNEYMESLWWIFNQIDKKGYLKKLQRTVPWCWRCQTPLSSHELGQPGVYQTTKDASLYFKVKLKDEDASLLVWTTTPWTLPGNLAVALSEKLEYSKFEVTKQETGAKEVIYSYNPLPEKEGFLVEKIGSVKGGNLIGKSYEPLFELSREQKTALKDHKLYILRAADFIETETGTGLVHIAPSFGEDDYRLMGINEGLPVTITDNARMKEGFPGAGKSIKDADADVVQDLDKRGLLYKFGKEKHEYPHCWRCKNALVYMVRKSWFIEMSKLSKELVAGNQGINWYPDHFKNGRFGKWLEDIKDWSVSRNRYWGTPLPIWQTADKDEERRETLIVSSLNDLKKHAVHKNTYYLMRHTEARHNVEQLIAAGEETNKENTSELTEKGKTQAEKVAALIKKEKIDYIFASPYKRTKDTAHIVAEKVGVKVIPLDIDRLKEIEAGVLSWNTIENYHAFFGKKKDRFAKKPEGAESWNDVRKRVMSFYKELEEKYKDKKILIVSHGDPLWILHGAVQGYSDQELLESDYYPSHTKWMKLESSNLPFNEEGVLDLHRPYIDAIKLKSKSGKEMARVEDVADVWFDAGAMPYASKGFPYKQAKTRDVSDRKAASLLKKLPFPADYIAEGIDQTRGWFYTLHAIAILLGKPFAFKNVICHGLINDKHGKKMSKSLGNTIEPSEVLKKYGADPLRWYLYTLNDIGENKNFNEDDLAKVARKVNFIIYNSYSFLKTYGSQARELAEKPENQLDAWILSQLNILVEKVTEGLDTYKIGQAGRAVEEFIDDMSRWYIRRSRPRFQEAAKGSKESADLDQASATLHHCLLTLSKLIAPFMPFFADALYQSLEGEEESVHLADWPVVDKKKINTDLSEQMSLVRNLAASALALRAKEKIKVRQPLSALIVKDSKLQSNQELIEILADEVNVKRVEFNTGLEAEEGLALNTEITKELREEGLVRELARTIQGLRQDAKYEMQDRIELYIASEDYKDLLEQNAEQICQAVHAKALKMQKTEHFDAEKQTELEGKPIWIAVKKL